MISNIYFFDFECLIVILTLFILLVKGLKERKVILEDSILTKDYSQLLKGISCLLILMAHYFTYRYSNQTCSWVHLAKFVGNFAANVALFFFMFISGYGLGVKKEKENIRTFVFHRCLKLYKPLLFVSICSVCIYYFIPDILSLTELKQARLSSNIYYIHHISAYTNDFFAYLLSADFDWYIGCILILYAIWWLSTKLVCLPYKQSLVLWFMVSIYIMWAFENLPAHYYRYSWAFVLGNFLAKKKTFSGKEKIILSLLILAMTLVTIFSVDLIQIISAIIFVILLMCAVWLNRRYAIESKYLLVLGRISFFVYLSHIRITATIFHYLNIESLLLSVLVTIFVSLSLEKVYEQLESRTIVKVLFKAK